MIHTFLQVCHGTCVFKVSERAGWIGNKGRYVQIGEEVIHHTGVYGDSVGHTLCYLPGSQRKSCKKIAQWA